MEPHMKTFKTSKGTELPFLNLKGKDYLQVAHRLVWFREDHKNASIKTEFLKLEESFAIAKATICTEDGITLAIAHGREDAKHFPDYMEKCETKAIGRALALCGYGTQFAPELDEGERLADAPLPRKPQIIIPPSQPISAKPIEAPSEPPTIPVAATSVQLNRIAYLLNKTKLDPVKITERIKKQFNKSEIKLLDKTEADWLIKSLEGVKS